MKEAVKIYVKGLQGGLADSQHEGEDEAIELITEGVLYHQHGHTYVVYDDMVLDEENPVKTTVKVHDGKVDIKRYGSIDHHMNFEAGTQHHSHYETPFGVLDITVATDHVDVNEEDYALNLNIKYQIEVNGAKIGDAFFEMRTEKL